MPATIPPAPNSIPDSLRAGSQLQLRVNDSNKRNWKAAARRHGYRSMSQWVIDTLNKRAGK